MDADALQPFVVIVLLVILRLLVSLFVIICRGISRAPETPSTSTDPKDH